MRKQILTVLALIASLTAYADDFVCTTNSLGVVKLSGYTGTNQLVIVPDTISTIGEKAFAKHSEIQTIYLPDSVTAIDNEAFADCYQIEHIRLSSKLNSLGNGVFNYCYSLDYIYIANEQLAIDYIGYKWWDVHTKTSPWIDYYIDGNVMTIVYEGTLQQSSDLKDWGDVNANGLYKVPMIKKLYFRSKQ